jgi:hypothetical protein
MDKNSSRASDGRLDLGDGLGDPSSISGEVELNLSSTSKSPIFVRSR